MRFVMRSARQVVSAAVANVYRRYSVSSNKLPYYVTKEDLSRYIEMVTAKFYPRSIMYANTAILKMKQGIQADIIVDGWPAFDCTIARLPESEEGSDLLFVLAGSQEKLENFILSLNYDGDAFIGGLDDDTGGFLSNMKRTWPFGLKEEILGFHKDYYFPGKLEDLMTWSCPQEAFVAKLKPGNAKLLGETWFYGGLNSRTQYMKYLIENCGSIGVFLKANPIQPVSWALLSNFGQIVHVYTLPEHRGKGYAKITTLAIMRKMLEIGMTPTLEVVGNDVTVTKVYSGLGFMELCNGTWRKYLQESKL